ncbi:hypothetical protein KCU67_g13005, partial [Aureobasidium melanogenum]
LRQNSPILKRWEGYGQAKVAVQVKSEEDLLILQAQAISLGICGQIIHDAGRTQIASGSATVLGVGPAPKSMVDQVTGHLKLFISLKTHLSFTLKAKSPSTVNFWATTKIGAMNELTRLYGLGARTANAYEEFRWGKTKKERPEIVSDKYTCCKPPTNAAHNSWWAYVQPPDYPRVIGYGKTLEEALTSVYPQLQLGPQQWMTIHGVQNQGNVIASGIQSQTSGTTITPSAPGFTLPKVSILVLEVRRSSLQHLPHCRCMDWHQFLSL